MTGRKSVFMFILVAVMMLLCSCENTSGERSAGAEEGSAGSGGETEMSERGYGLPVADAEKEEAAEDCENVMGLIRDIYRQADKGEAINAVLSEETIERMQEVIEGAGYPVIGPAIYSAMGNYRQVEQFLLGAEQGETGSVILYMIASDGGLGRQKYIYDGEDMYVLSARAAWNDADEPTVTYVSYTRIKEWRYTKKGWFGYEMCVPEPPEVTEVVDGNCMIRVKPMSDECRELSEKCVAVLGYQGNNLLCSDWSEENLADLDYNGMYEYLYQMKYQSRVDSENSSEGIPAEEFESVIREYLPVTSEQIREWAVYDEENQTYAWERLDCTNGRPTFFGTSVPEVVQVRENEEGTLTLTVDAVCDMGVCDDAVITHELTVRFAEDGSFQYLGNQILDDGIRKIPAYRYRFGDRK